ncbi:hypothetical protein HPB52_015294 [Rhipicephalus sanguineus]|uniref:Uncharacterized protein n=1 Tax=Rhipicephalus sanguineus TaxID=34632 RepID=A0A9D4T7N4_RHISA|nr:hypothetical protein HPB52_015294 [Rhipicephalus sanguineus]
MFLYRGLPFQIQEQSQAAITGVGRAQGVRLEAVISGPAIRTCDYGTLRRRSLASILDAAMSRSAQNSETIIFLTEAPRDEEKPPATESRRPNSRNQTSLKTVYKIVQQAPPPSPPPPEEDEEQRELSMSISLEETNAPMRKAPGLPSGSQVLRVLPQGTSIVLEQVSAPPPPRPPSSSMPPRRKSLPASMPPKSPKPQSRPPSRSKSRPLSPPIIKVLKIKFEIGGRSGSEEGGRSERRGHSKSPEPCLDCLEEFIRRKRAEKQRRGTDTSSQVEVTMSKKRVCSRRSSKSVATTSSVQSYRCPKCMACKSCGSINVTVPIARK